MRAAVVVLAGLMPVLDVLLQRGVALVAPRAVRAGVQLGEGVWRACSREVMERGANQVHDKGKVGKRKRRRRGGQYGTVFIRASSLGRTLVVLRSFRVDDGRVALLEDLLHQRVLHILVF